MARQACYPNGDVHEGEFKDGVPHGMGKAYFDSMFCMKASFRTATRTVKVNTDNGTIFVGKFQTAGPGPCMLGPDGNAYLRA